MLFARILISPLRTRAVTGESYLRRMAIEEYGYQRMVEVTKGNIRQGDFWVSAVLRTATRAVYMKRFSCRHGTSGQEIVCAVDREFRPTRENTRIRTRRRSDGYITTVNVAGAHGNQCKG